MIKNKKVLLFTSTRADFGLLINLSRLFESDKSIDLYIITTGGHFEKNQGYTITEVEKENFNKLIKIKTTFKNNTSDEITKSFSNALDLFSQKVKKIKPDIAIVLGDRYEALAFALSCYINHVSIAHLCGGEITRGALDDSFRHSITKFSTLHFAGSKKYKERIISMGENPKSVFSFGILGHESVSHNKFISLAQVEKNLKIKLMKPFAIATYHPLTIDLKTSINGLKSLLSAICVDQKRNYYFTAPNLDESGKMHLDLILKYVKEYNHIHLVSSFGRDNYLSALKHADFMIGNSSSGIYEAPAIGIPTINIGLRQDGREFSDSVICTDESIQKISSAIKHISLLKYKRKKTTRKLVISKSIYSEILKFLKNPYPKYTSFNEAR